MLIMLGSKTSRKKVNVLVSVKVGASMTSHKLIASMVATPLFCLDMCKCEMQTQYVKTNQTTMGWIIL